MGGNMLIRYADQQMFNQNVDQQLETSTRSLGRWYGAIALHTRWFGQGLEPSIEVYHPTLTPHAAPATANTSQVEGWVCCVVMRIR